MFLVKTHGYKDDFGIKTVQTSKYHTTEFLLKGWEISKKVRQFSPQNPLKL